MGRIGRRGVGPAWCGGAGAFARDGIPSSVRPARDARAAAIPLQRRGVRCNT
ncbi:hypothetical protein BVI2075_860008 [Burkholderia vietnamiensis]|nr:hypothetical protein BVI2075_860008 [Burkholderia vietnamiensis]